MYNFMVKELKRIENIMCCVWCHLMRESDWRSVISGIPQGSVIGPVLFLICINNIVNDLHSSIFEFANYLVWLVRIWNVKNCSLIWHSWLSGRRNSKWNSMSTSVMCSMKAKVNRCIRMQWKNEFWRRATKKQILL